MTPQQQQYYSFLEESRRRAVRNQLLTMQTVAILRKAIIAGKDPRVDPDLRKYWLLIDEQMQQLLIDEMNRLHLTFEEDSTPIGD